MGGLYHIERTEFTKLKEVKIFVQAPDVYPLEPPVAGRAYCPDTIRVEGWLYKGRIVLDQTALGHEVWHLLNCQKPDRFWNPDKLDKELMF